MKKQHTYTRKDKGVRWLLRLALLLVLLNLTGIYHIHPDQTLKAPLQKAALAPVEVIHREWAGMAPEPAVSILEDSLLLVGQNRDAVTLMAAEFHPLAGWYDSGPVSEILFEDPTTWNRSWTVRDSDYPEKEWVCLFGFVPTGEEPPTFKVGMYDYRVPFGEGEFENAGDYVVYGGYHFDPANEPQTVTPTPTIPVKGGMCYLVQLNVVHKTLDIEQWDCVVLCDESGEWEKTTHWWSSSK